MWAEEKGWEQGFFPRPNMSPLRIVEFTESTGPEIFFVTGLMNFVTAIARLVCPDLLITFYKHLFRAQYKLDSNFSYLLLIFIRCYVSMCLLV